MESIYVFFKTKRKETNYPDFSQNFLFVTMNFYSNEQQTTLNKGNIDGRRKKEEKKNVVKNPGNLFLFFWL